MGKFSVDHESDPFVRTTKEASEANERRYCLSTVTHPNDESMHIHDSSVRAASEASEYYYHLHTSLTNGFKFNDDDDARGSFVRSSTESSECRLSYPFSLVNGPGERESACESHTRDSHARESHALAFRGIDDVAKRNGNVELVLTATQTLKSHPFLLL